MEEEGECGDMALGPEGRDQGSGVDRSHLKGSDIRFPASGLLLFPSFLVKSVVMSSFSVTETEAQGS